MEKLSTNTEAELHDLAKIIDASQEHLFQGITAFYDGEPAIHPNLKVGVEVSRAWGLAATMTKHAKRLRSIGANVEGIEEAPPAPSPDAARDDEFDARRKFPHELLSERLYQARGLSMLMYGEGGECLSRLRADLREGVCWALASLIDDAFSANRRIEEGATS